MKVSLLIDGEDIQLNEFISEFLAGTLQGAISPVRNVKSDWKELELKIKR